MISSCKDNKWTVIGPAPSLIAKVGNKFRWQILIHGPESSEFPLPDRSNLWQKIPKNVFLSIDLNPVDLYLIRWKFWKVRSYFVSIKP